MKFMVPQVMAVLHRRAQKPNTRLLVKFFVLLIGLITLYSVLFHVLMIREGQDHSWMTGFYWTLTVMSTLGFGDITFTGDLGRAFSIIVLLSGVVFLLVMLPFTFITFLYAPWLEEQNKARAPRELPEETSGHVVLTLFDAVADNLIARLHQYQIPYVLLIPDLREALHLIERGFRVVVGEVDDPETYRRLRVPHAKLVVVMNDDVTSTNIIFTIREVSERVETVTNVDLEDSLDILHLAGSTHVFQFTKMLGESLARRVMGAGMKVNVIGQLDDLLIAEAPAMATSIEGKTLAESRLRQITGANVVGIWDQSGLIIPRPDTRIGSSSVLVLAGSQAQLDRYDEVIGSRSGTNGRHGPVLVLGGGRVGQSVALALQGRGVDYRVVEKRTSLAAGDSRIIQGSAADFDVLDRAGIRETPSIIITTHDDNLNIYLAIYCRRLRPDVQIICRASLDRNVNTLHRAGANLVMSFSSLFTTTILNILKPGKLLMLTEGLNIFRAVLGPNFPSKPLLDQNIRETTECSVIAVKRKGKTTINPDPTMVIEPGDEVVLIGTAEAEKRFNARYPAE